MFVNSNVTELADALKIFADFKKAINERYKLPEIDLDGDGCWSNAVVRMAICRARQNALKKKGAQVDTRQQRGK